MKRKVIQRIATAIDPEIVLTSHGRRSRFRRRRHGIGRMGGVGHDRGVVVEVLSVGESEAESERVRAGLRHKKIIGILRHIHTHDADTHTHTHTHT